MSTPWHPALVHFPIVLSLLSPGIVLWVWWVVRQSKCTPKLWRVVVAIQLFSFLTGVAAFKTGETDERRMITVVPMSEVHAHEERATTFLWLSGISTVAGAAALFLPGVPATVLQAACLFASGGAGVAAALTGKSGGELVYGFGAARPFVEENRVTESK